MSARYWLLLRCKMADVQLVVLGAKTVITSLKLDLLNPLFYNTEPVNC